MKLKRRIGMLLLLLAVMLVGPMLWLLGVARKPIPTLRFAGSEATATRVVIVLPGIHDGLESLKSTGMAAAIHRAMPKAEVILTGASPAYYLGHTLIKRLEQDVIAPARARGAEEIWLVGVSLGGFGALLYEHANPGAVNGIALLAPFMGRPGYWRAIAAAGGLNPWQPGPALSWWHPDDMPHEIWTMVRNWPQHPRIASRIWVACGSDDAFLTPARLVGNALATDHLLEFPGGHESALWPAAAEQLLARAEAANLVHQVEAATPESGEAKP